MSHLAIPTAPALPRRIYVEPEAAALVPLVMGAIERWHRLRPGLFVLTGKSQDADVLVRLSGETWVDMEATPVVLRWAAGETADYWFAHELGHTLGLGDHGWPGLDMNGNRKYIGLVIDSDDPNRYKGCMSYNGPVSEWFGNEDAAMISEHWPLAHRVIMPEVST